MRIDPAFRRFVSYIDRSREYYAAQGFERAYRWAAPEQPPAFQPLPAPLSTLCLGLVTTAFPLPEVGETAPPEVPYARLVDEPWPLGGYTADENRHTGAAPANEAGSYLPLRHLAALADEGRVARLSPRFYGLPYDYSQRRTMEEAAPAILEYVREDEVDVVMVVPHCPVCHQSAALTARHLEQNGVPTVLVGSARDIIEEIGVPRFLFTDLPLGYPLGRPGDAEGQARVCAQGLALLEGAWEPETTVRSDAAWENEAWRSSYMRVDETTRAQLIEAGELRRAQQAEARTQGE